LTVETDCKHNRILTVGKCLGCPQCQTDSSGSCSHFLIYFKWFYASKYIKKMCQGQI